MQDKFLALIRKYEADLKKENKVFNTIGYVKLSLVLLLGYLIYLAVTREFPLELIILAAFVFLISIALWVYHAKLHNKTDYLKGIISVYSQYIARITGKWTKFEDTGAGFADVDHAYSGDLDIIGAKSLFQFLNTTHTWHGRQAFANDLLHAEYEHSELRQRQEAIAELSRDIEFSGKIQYYLSKIKADAYSSTLAADLKDSTPFTKYKIMRVLLTYMPAFTLLFIISMLVFSLRNLYAAGVTLIAAQAVIWVLGILPTGKYLQVMARMPYKLSAYCDIIDILTGRDFSCEKLNDIKKALREANRAVKDLSRISTKLSVRNSGVIWVILNILLLWDYDCAFMLEKWKVKYAPLAEQWFSAIGEFESLLCFSHLPNVCNNTCLPTITEKANMIEAQAMGHPLLPNEKRVDNNFSFNDNIFIVSGSNMSGKTTFLRTVGINILLARCGSFVCAEKMILPLLSVVTSIRIADDLNEGVSTFYAELKRIRRIIDFAEKRSDAVFLIDEIFKGTNSADRLAGAKTVIAKLNNLGASGLISTHDLELCELSGIHGRIKNYSFSEHYKDNRIYFDYKVKPGKSTTTNAKYLMKMLDIFD